MYDMGSREIVVSRHEIFHEETYPFRFEIVQQDTYETRSPLPIMLVVEDNDLVEIPILSNTNSNASVFSPLENDYSSSEASRNVQVEPTTARVLRHSVRLKKQPA